MGKRKLRKTIIIICEGKTDEAFLLHLRKNYCNLGPGGSPPSIRVKPAGGKGADNVINSLFAEVAQADFDIKIAMIDEDIPPSPKALKTIKSIRGEIITIKPNCLEGLLLDIIQERPASNSPDCKRIMHARLNDPCQKESYEILFSKAILEERRKTNELLDRILRIFE